MGEEDGVVFSGTVARGRDAAALFGTEPSSRRLGTDVKLIYAVATNALVNQHANVNRTARILADESKVEFLVVQDNFLTPTARFADVVLPACTQFETWGVEDGWKYGDEVILMPKVVEPPGECRSDYRICADLAKRLGVEKAFTEERDERGWVEWVLDRYRETRFPDLPPLDDLLEKNVGVWAKPVTRPAVAFEEFRGDPEAHPLDTPRGRSRSSRRRSTRRGGPTRFPPFRKYVEEWESPFGQEAATYPLQVIGHHTLHRVHSTHDNNDWLEEAFPQRVYLNPLDAGERGVADGDEVRVFNGRGAVRLRCRVTSRILPGVIDIPQGAWWTPDERGEDRRGNVNVLTSERWTPLAYGTAQHTAMAEVERAEKGSVATGRAKRPRPAAAAFRRREGRR
ncbi:MAG: molybdopterin-dependent oxidoreductase [Holophagales bacterium]|nr:molybdopterin-dependent oxidoreductase [Holophagales bacterium]